MAVDSVSTTPNPNNSGTALGRLPKIISRINPMIFAFFIIYFGLALLSERFLTEFNQMNITRQVAVYLILALGQTFVIVTRGIDLSVGSALGLTACVMGVLIQDNGFPVWLGVASAIVLGGLIGLVNGIVVTKLSVPPLIATLGMLVTLRGATHLFMQADVVVRMPEALVWIGQGTIGPIPVPAIIGLILVIVTWWLYNQTRFGRYMTAIGSNESACRLVGIHVDRWKISAYILQGAFVGLAAAVIVGRLNGANPQIGLNYELHVIAAVVLGGTSLFGGYGTILGTLFGILTLGVLENGTVLIGADFHVQRVIIGILLISAVAYQGWRYRRRGALE